MVWVESVPVSPDAVPSPWGGSAWVTFGAADRVRALRVEGRVTLAAATGRATTAVGTGDTVERAAVLTELAAALVELADPDAPQVVADAVDACMALPDSPASTFLLALASGTAALHAAADEVLPVVRATIARATAWGLRDVVARSANTLGHLLSTTDPAAAWEALEQSRAASRALVDEDPALMVRWFINAAAVVAQSGRFEAAAALALEGLDLATERGLRAASGAHLAAAAVENLLADGDLALARATLRPWLPRGEEGRDRWWLVALEGRLALLRGETEEAVTCLRSLDRDAPGGLPASAASARALLRAEMWALTGSRDRTVRVALDGAADVVEADPVTAVEIVVLAADVAAVRGRRWSWGLVEAAWAGLPFLHDDLVAPWRSVLEARRAEVHGEDPRRAWRRALDAADRRLPVAWTVRVALASARAHGARGSAHTAREHVARARGLVDDHGLLGLDLQTRVVEAELSAEHRLPTPLTRREEQVLGLLATGASNRDIAEALALSHRTVEAHVGSILRKLGAGTRTGAVARGRELGLSGGDDVS